MADITFDAKLREKAGKGAARACRREGRVPAVIYGGNKEALMISLDPVQLEKALDMVGFYDADIEINVAVATIPTNQALTRINHSRWINPKSW